MRWILKLLAVLCLATGVAGLLAPGWMAETAHLHDRTPAHWSEIRAVYFAWAGYGAALLLALRRQRTEGLRTLALVFACMAAARGFSLVLDGVHGYIVVALLLEGAMAAICMAGIPAVRQSRS